MNNPSVFSPRFVYWSKTIGQFSLIQLTVQALAAASGVLIIRALDQSQYACFTLANSMQATIVVLADSGVAMGLSSIGGRIWRDRFRFGQLIRTALWLQKYLAILASAVVVPLLLWMMRRHGVPVGYSFWITAVVLLGLVFQLSAGVLGVVPRFYSQIKRLQNLHLLIAAFRFALLYLAYRLFLNAIIAVFIAVITMALQYGILRRWVSEEVDAHAPIHREDRAEIMGIVTQQAPNGVFYCLQGQLTVWLISFFGSTKNIADVGSLSRLAIIYSVIASLMSNIILPGFSRCQSRRRLRLQYFQIVGAFALFGAFVLAITAAFPRQCLWILGKNYAHLHEELFLMAASIVAASVVDAMWSMNAAKAWVQNCWIEIPLRIAVQIALLFRLDLSTVRGVLLFGALSNLSPFLVNLFLTYNGLWKYGFAGAAETPLPRLAGKADVRAA